MIFQLPNLMDQEKRSVSKDSDSEEEDVIPVRKPKKRREKISADEPTLNVVHFYLCVGGLKQVIFVDQFCDTREEVDA